MASSTSRAQCGLIPADSLPLHHEENWLCTLGNDDWLGRLSVEYLLGKHKIRFSIDSDKYGYTVWIPKSVFDHAVKVWDRYPAVRRDWIRILKRGPHVSEVQCNTTVGRLSLDFKQSGNGLMASAFSKLKWVSRAKNLGTIDRIVYAERSYIDAKVIERKGYDVSLYYRRIEDRRTLFYHLPFQVSADGVIWLGHEYLEDSSDEFEGLPLNHLKGLVAVFSRAVAGLRH